MSLQIRLTDWVTAVGTDVKDLRTKISGDATGALTSLTTTSKTSLISAINEVNAKPSTAPANASETVVGIVEIATQVETDAGTLDGNYVVSPLKFATRLAAYAQAKSANLTALDISSTAYGRGFLSLANQAGLMGLITTATELVSGQSRFATQTETNAGTLDTVVVTPLKFQTRLAAYAQPLAAELTSLAGQTSTAYGRGFLTLVNQAGLMGLLRAASETVTGVSRLSTQTETNTGTDDTTSVSPLKFQTRLAAYAQQLNSNLTTLAGIVSGATGQSLLQAATPAAAKTTLGLATVATSGSAADLSGVLPTSALPALAINDTFVVVSQAAMLALTAQRGDFAIRSDINRSFVLSTDSPTTLADWKQVTAGGDVVSVSGRTGTVTLTSTDVGLANVDNTSDVNKPVSTAQATADNLRLLKTANLSDVANAATSLSNLGGIASSAIGNPETDLVAAYTTAKA